MRKWIGWTSVVVLLVAAGIVCGAPSGTPAGNKGLRTHPAWGQGWPQGMVGQQLMAKQPEMKGLAGTPAPRRGLSGTGTRMRPQGMGWPQGGFMHRQLAWGPGTGRPQATWGKPSMGWRPGWTQAKAPTAQPVTAKRPQIITVQTVKERDEGEPRKAWRGLGEHPRAKALGVAFILFVVLPVVLTLFWVLPITLGLHLVRRRKYSPLWMLFGIHPLGGWITCLVLALSKGKVECASCGGYIKRNFSQCPYCHSPVSAAE